MREKIVPKPEPPDPRSPIEDLRLPPRAYRSLKAAGYHTLEQVMRAAPEDLLQLRNFGARCLGILTERLRKMGREIDPWAAFDRRKRDQAGLLGMPIEQIGLSDDLVDRLHLAQIETVGELVGRSRKDLLKFPSLGARSVGKIRSVLHDVGLDLGMDVVSAGPAGVWMDRLDAARIRLNVWMATPAGRYFFSREFGISDKTLGRFLDGSPLTPYEIRKLRALFRDTIDLAGPFDYTRSRAYRALMDVVDVYRAERSLKRAAAKLACSHEHVRKSLALAERFGLVARQHH